MNDLLAEYSGPVLLCQGALDPLVGTSPSPYRVSLSGPLPQNDAKSRAGNFSQIRPGVSVDLLELGHCPMDEDPETVSTSIRRWWTQQQGQERQQQEEEVEQVSGDSIIVSI
jgi:pimeloyl-ACP methyl ester carboxylesterase